MARLQKAKKKEDLLLKCVCTHAGGGAGAGGHAGGPGDLLTCQLTHISAHGSKINDAVL